jgi:hypothetical protein
MKDLEFLGLCEVENLKDLEVLKLRRIWRFMGGSWKWFGKGLCIWVSGEMRVGKRGIETDLKGSEGGYWLVLGLRI